MQRKGIGVKGHWRTTSSTSEAYMTATSGTRRQLAQRDNRETLVRRLGQPNRSMTVLEAVQKMAGSNPCPIMRGSKGMTGENSFAGARARRAGQEDQLAIRTVTFPTLGYQKAWLIPEEEVSQTLFSRWPASCDMYRHHPIGT